MGKAIAIAYVIYYLVNHKNVARSLWKVIKFSFKLVLLGISYYIGVQFYSVTSGGITGATIAIMDVFFLISPYLYFKYMSKDDGTPLGFIRDTVRLIAFEIFVLFSGAVIYGIVLVAVEVFKINSSPNYFLKIEIKIKEL